jgi:hypothetical protein
MKNIWFLCLFVAADITKKHCKNLTHISFLHPEHQQYHLTCSTLSITTHFNHRCVCNAGNNHWTTNLESDLQEGILIGPHISTVWHITYTTDNIINIDTSADKLIITSSKCPVLVVPVQLGTLTAVHYCNFICKYTEHTWRAKNLPNTQEWSFGHSLWDVHVLPTKMFFEIVLSSWGLTHQSLNHRVMKETAAWPTYVVGIFPCHSYTV